MNINIHNLNRFRDRLAKIGVTIEMKANYPWVYLDKVNGVKVLAKFQSEHAFTAFYIGSNGFRFSDRRAVFNKIRQILAFEQYMILTQEISDE